MLLEIFFAEFVPQKIIGMVANVFLAPQKLLGMETHVSARLGTGMEMTSALFALKERAGMKMFVSVLVKENGIEKIALVIANQDMNGIKEVPNAFLPLQYVDKLGFRLGCFFQPMNVNVLPTLFGMLNFGTASHTAIWMQTQLAFQLQIGWVVNANICINGMNGMLNAP